MLTPAAQVRSWLPRRAERSSRHAHCLSLYASTRDVRAPESIRRFSRSGAKRIKISRTESNLNQHTQWQLFPRSALPLHIRHVCEGHARRRLRRSSARGYAAASISHISKSNLVCTFPAAPCRDEPRPQTLTLTRRTRLCRPGSGWARLASGHPFEGYSLGCGRRCCKMGPLLCELCPLRRQHCSLHCRLHQQALLDYELRRLPLRLRSQRCRRSLLLRELAGRCRPARFLH